jgi:hypothetical protein
VTQFIERARTQVRLHADVGPLARQAGFGQLIDPLFAAQAGRITIVST